MLLQGAYSGVVQAPAAAAAVLPAPTRLVAAPAAASFVSPVAAPYVAAPVAAPLAAPFAAAPLIAAPAPFAAYTKAVPQAVAPFASSLNFVARSPYLPYTAVAGAPVVSPYVEAFSAPLVAKKVAAAPLVAASAPYISTIG